MSEVEMDAAVCSVPTVIGPDCLEGWMTIGAGGFGKIYKAKHKNWGRDIAIKFLLTNDQSGSELQREAELMRHGGNPNVLMIFGVFRDESLNRWGLVMEYMERGSLSDLQGCLCGPPPWPLAFRIIYQIALGMNFLHNLSPPLLHLDLKPNNVLLDDSLKVKITDFGLAKLVQSVSKGSGQEDSSVGGTTSFMPPEAFQSTSYKPNGAFDVYSYGILLWSVITGKEPYTNAANMSSLIRLCIREGQRPDMSLVDSSQVEGLSDVVELMKSCWNQEYRSRPSFIECIKVTSKVYEQHKKDVYDAVSDVLKQLDSKANLSSSFESMSLTKKSNNVSKEKDRGSHPSVQTGVYPTQESGGSARLRQAGSAPQFNPALSPRLKYKAAQVPPAPHRPPVTQRQNSTPATVISIKNAIGVQIGNNNSMNLGHSRRRHLTAPDKVTVPRSSQRPKHQQDPHHPKP